MVAPRIVCYLASSLDGYIADRDGGVGWLSRFADVDTGTKDFMASVTIQVMGRTTFDHARRLGPWPPSKARTVVLTHRPLDGGAPPGVTTLSGPAADVAGRLRKEARGGDIWLMGGGRVLAGFLDAGEVDRLDLFLVPVLLGEGVRLFCRRPERPQASLNLENTRSYSRGVARLTYAPPSAPSPSQA